MRNMEVIFSDFVTIVKGVFVADIHKRNVVKNHLQVFRLDFDKQL